MTSSKPLSSLNPLQTSALWLSVLAIAARSAIPSAAIALSVPDVSVSLDPVPLSTPAAPKSAAPLQVESAEVFVDKTDYSLGATQPIDPETALSDGGLDRVNVQIESRQAASSRREREATQVS